MELKPEELTLLKKWNKIFSKRKILSFVLCIIFSLFLVSYGDKYNKNQVTQNNSIDEQTNIKINDELNKASEDKSLIENLDNDVINKNEIKENNMKIYFDDIEIPVTWENNETVLELQTEAERGEITVAMSMYSDNEQVGPLRKNYTRNDKQITTNNRDIVLYNGNQIVVFYGSNSWSYTKIGKINLSEKEVTDLLSNGDITLKIAK
ncbi:hypothetical protein SAMN04487886_107317 [Clostridium sp. DSM 8431]|uniref:cyclophilin-like fold protein n=1 Tax=Clostridium sp. DSM 8431 TaxID=1761781 RepID=UPI0008DECB0C|nr:cyclophilin-like fold protein [Clostridium sp. DSM 8431]SFU60851.1 hypothetical protein SAMN04487886_107317 [Clostridium sp. DSM 8431]